MYPADSVDDQNVDARHERPLPATERMNALVAS
jgi:hypothetical protein